MDIDEFCRIMRGAAVVSQLSQDTFRVMYGLKKFAILSVVIVKDSAESEVAPVAERAAEGER